LREGLKDWLGPWQEYYSAELEMIDSGERVLRLTRATARMPGSSSTVTLPAAQVWTFRDGMIVSYESTQTTPKPSKPSA
jgi:hypothetical protein